MLNQKSKKKIITFLFIFILGGMVLQINLFMRTADAQSGNNWYVGKGVASIVIDHPVGGFTEVFNTHVSGDEKNTCGVLLGI